MIRSQENNGKKSICASCGKRVTLFIDTYRHPLLGTVQCSTCHYNYKSVGDLSKYRGGVDNNGSESYCRWCLDGGELILCTDTNCRQGFCSVCIKRNLGDGYMHKIQSTEWYCFVCDYTQLDSLRLPDPVVEPVKAKEIPPIDNVVVEAAKELEIELSKETNIEAMNEKDIELAQETEVAPVKEKEPLSTKQVDIVSDEEKESLSTKQMDIVPIKEKESLSAKQLDIEPLKEIDIDSGENMEVEPLKEKEIESSENMDFEEVKEIEIDSIKQMEVEIFKENDIEAVKEKEVEMIQENDIEPVKEKEVEMIQENVIEPVKEKEVDMIKEAEPIKQLEIKSHKNVVNVPTKKPFKINFEIFSKSKICARHNPREEREKAASLLTNDQLNDQNSDQNTNPLNVSVTGTTVKLIENSRVSAIVTKNSSSNDLNASLSKSILVNDETKNRELIKSSKNQEELIIALPDGPTSTTIEQLEQELEISEESDDSEEFNDALNVTPRRKALPENNVKKSVSVIDEWARTEGDMLHERLKLFCDSLMYSCDNYREIRDDPKRLISWASSIETTLSSTPHIIDRCRHMYNFI